MTVRQVVVPSSGAGAPSPEVIAEAARLLAMTSVAVHGAWIRCFYCGGCLGPFHKDHVVPLSRGGIDSPFNVVVACEKCNLSKGALLPSEWKRTLSPAVYELEARAVAKHENVDPRAKKRERVTPDRPCVLCEVCGGDLSGDIRTGRLVLWASHPDRTSVNEEERKPMVWRVVFGCAHGSAAPAVCYAHPPGKHIHPTVIDSEYVTGRCAMGQLRHILLGHRFEPGALDDLTALFESFALLPTSREAAAYLDSLGDSIPITPHVERNR